MAKNSYNPLWKSIRAVAVYVHLASHWSLIKSVNFSPLGPPRPFKRTVLIDVHFKNKSDMVLLLFLNLYKYTLFLCIDVVS